MKDRSHLGTLGLRASMSYKRNPRLKRPERIATVLLGGLALLGCLYAIVHL